MQNQQLLVQEVALKKNRLKVAKLQMNRRKIHAPFTGQVAQTYVQPGEWLKPGDPVFRIIDLSQLKAEGFLAADLAKKFSSGDKVHLIAPTGSDSVPLATGTLKFISPERDPITQQVRFWAILDNSSAKLQPGLKVKIRIFPAQTSNIKKNSTLRILQAEFHQRHVPRTISPQEIQAFLGRAYQASLLFSHRPDQGKSLLARRVEERNRKLFYAWTQLFAIQFRGLDPDRWLTKTSQRLRPFVSLSRLTGGMGVLLLIAFTLLIGHWENFTARAITVTVKKTVTAEAIVLPEEAIFVFITRPGKIISCPSPSLNSSNHRHQRNSLQTFSNPPQKDLLPSPRLRTPLVEIGNPLVQLSNHAIRSQQAVQQETVKNLETELLNLRALRLIAGQSGPRLSAQILNTQIELADQTVQLTSYNSELQQLLVTAPVRGRVFPLPQKKILGIPPK